MNKSNKNPNELVFRKNTKDSYNYCTIDIVNLYNIKQVRINNHSGDYDDPWQSDCSIFYFNKKQLSKLIKHLQKLEKQLDVNV